MKTLLIILTFIATTAVAQKVSKKERIARDKVYTESLKHFTKKDYFTALDLIARKYKYITPDQNVQHYIEELTTHTGTHYFNTYSDLELRKLNIPTTQLIMGKRNFYLKKYKHGIKRLNTIPKGHRLYPESLLIKASSYYFMNKHNKAIETYELCSEYALKNEKNFKEKSKTGRYYAIIKESCIINIARIHFDQSQYSKAIEQYDKIPKSSFKWPYILIEKAWSYYYLNDHNRSLGILMTYDSPLLESYFMPEAKLLITLNYFDLCLYDDALNTIHDFYNTYKTRSETLLGHIKSAGNKDLYFFNLMFSPIADNETKNKFLRNIVTQMSKRLKYNFDINSLFQMNQEVYRSNKTANIKLLKNMQRDLKEQINHYVKRSVYTFSNKIYDVSKNMFDIKLEILSLKRDLAYKNKTYKKDRKRGDLENLNIKSNQEYWSFQDAFWADELGEYSFALKSKCETQKMRF